MFQIVNEATRQPLDSPILRCLREGRIVELDEPTLLINRRLQEISIQDSAAPIRDRDGTLIGAVMVFHDVSQERRLQRALTYQATHDQLTGLMNRREFESRLAEALQAARQDEKLSHVLMYLDLDQFKVVNDTCGHEAGDRLLKQVTSIVQTRIRTTDTLARLGGDEFGVLLQDCTLDSAQRTAEGLRQAIRDFRFVWHDRIMNVGVSIGLAEINGHADTLATRDERRRRRVLRRPRIPAATACRPTSRVAHPSAMREMQWVSRINRACEEDQLVLLAQTIVPIRARRGQAQALRAAAADAGRAAGRSCSQPNSFPPPSAST